MHRSMQVTGVACRRDVCFCDHFVFWEGRLRTLLEFHLKQRPVAGAAEFFWGGARSCVVPLPVTVNGVSVPSRTTHPPHLTARFAPPHHPTIPALCHIPIPIPPARRRRRHPHTPHVSRSEPHPAATTDSCSTVPRRWSWLPTTWVARSHLVDPLAVQPSLPVGRDDPRHHPGRRRGRGGATADRDESKKTKKNSS